MFIGALLKFKIDEKAYIHISYPSLKNSLG